MVSILVNNGYLDLYFENDITFEWTSFIFSSTVKEPYSTDFKVPMTSTNIRLLGLTNLQDETDFDFQEDWVKGVLICDERPKNVDIQIISVTDSEIELFMVESNPVTDFLSKNLVKKFDTDEEGILIDSDATIYPWWYGSVLDRPNVFLKYDYGSYYNPLCAQLHPSKNLKDILQEAMQPFGLNTEGLLSNTDYGDYAYLTATNKYVCPQNRRQVIRGRLGENGIYVYGGQHITNDISTDVDEQKTTFEVNRDCRLRGTLTFSFFSTKANKVNETNGEFVLRNMTTQQNIFLYVVPSLGYRNRALQYDIDVELPKGEYSFTVSNPDKYTDDKFAFFITGEVYDYETTADDCETELEYYNDRAYPEIFDSNGDTVTYHKIEYHINRNMVKTGYLYRQKYQTALDDVADAVFTEIYHYSYIGLYCNLPEVSVKDLFYNLAWMTNRKLNYDKYQVISFVPFRVYTPVDGDYSIEKTDYKYERFGQTTVFKCANEELEDVDPSDTFTIKNRWLEKTVAVKSSILARLKEGIGQIAVIPQYSEFKTENLEYEAKYDEIEGLCLTVNDPDKKQLEPIDYFIPSMVGTRRVHIPRLCLDTVKQIYKVEVKIYNSVDMSSYDFLDINGRLHYIISGDNNLDVPYMTVRAILINNTEPFLFDANGELTTYQ